VPIVSYSRIKSSGVTSLPYPVIIIFETKSIPNSLDLYPTLS
jgi:hypothetical protein